MIKKEKGITLIALIITIIILIILAAVSIMAAYNSGIIDYSINGTKKYQEEANKEGSIISETEEFMKSILAKLDDIPGNNEKPELPTKPGSEPYLPSDDFEPIPDTDFTTGIVIEDKSPEGNGNQFVWVEVPNDGTGPNYSSVVDENDTEHIEAALKAYTSDYSDEDYNDYYYDTCGISNESEYDDLYEEMLKSIYTHGGFWIGKYETGIEESFRTYAAGEVYWHENQIYPVTETPVIKKDAYPFNFVIVSQAQSLANSINSGEYTSSLMFGIQWDLVMKYLELNATWPTTENKKQYLMFTGTWDNYGPGSTSFGNYPDAEFDITSTGAKYNALDIEWELTTWKVLTVDTENFVENGTKLANNDDWDSSNGAVILTTGANETRNSKMNIVDIAGNVGEWTLEQYNNGYSIAVCRGIGGRSNGNPISDGIYGAASSRSSQGYYGDARFDTSYCTIGFRVCLF